MLEPHNQGSKTSPADRSKWSPAELRLLTSIERALQDYDLSAFVITHDCYVPNPQHPKGLKLAFHTIDDAGKSLVVGVKSGSNKDIFEPFKGRAVSLSAGKEQRGAVADECLRLIKEKCLAINQAFDESVAGIASNFDVNKVNHLAKHSEPPSKSNAAVETAQFIFGYEGNRVVATKRSHLETKNGQTESRLESFSLSVSGAETDKLNSFQATGAIAKQVFEKLAELGSERP